VPDQRPGTARRVVELAVQIITELPDVPKPGSRKPRARRSDGSKAVGGRRRRRRNDQAKVSAARVLHTPR